MITVLATVLVPIFPILSIRYFINVSNIPIAAPVVPRAFVVLPTHAFAGPATAVLLKAAPGAAAFELVTISFIPSNKLTLPPKSLTPPDTNSGAAFLIGSTGHSLTIFTPSNTSQTPVPTCIAPAIINKMGPASVPAAGINAIIPAITCSATET